MVEKTSSTPDNETRQRILDAAGELFTKRGYAGVKLRDIGAAVGIHHASLYYYAPGGKEQLFIEVMERTFKQHEAGMRAVIAEAGDDLRAQFRAVSRWLATQPPMDMVRMNEADMLKLDEGKSARLMQMAYDAMRMPIVEALERAGDAGVVAVQDLDAAAMALVSLAQSVHSIPKGYPMSMRLRVSEYLADLLLDGLLKRGE